MDGDGDIDIVVASGDIERVYWVENNGGQNYQSRQIDSDTNPRSVFLADVDNDGDLDVIAAFADSDKVKWYENDGAANPSFTTHTISSSVDGAMSVYATDLDSDGDIDIVAAAQEEDKIYWFESDGAADPSFSATTITSSADGIYSVYAKDLDNDGDMDIMSASANDDKIAWYENNGAGDPSFTARTIATTADGAASVFAADIDGDGDQDIISASLNDNTVAWYENGLAAFGDPTFASANITTSRWSGSDPITVDIDNDGDLDIIGACVC